MTFTSNKGELWISSHGAYNVTQKLQTIVILGVAACPQTVKLGGKTVDDWIYEDSSDKLMVNVDVSLNRPAKLRWE
jgi:alpha-glucosidase